MFILARSLLLLLDISTAGSTLKHAFFCEGWDFLRKEIQHQDAAVTTMTMFFSHYQYLSLKTITCMPVKMLFKFFTLKLLLKTIPMNL